MMRLFRRSACPTVALLLLMTGCATAPLKSHLDAPVITYEKAVAAGIEHVRDGQCRTAYEEIKADFLSLEGVEYVHTGHLDLVIVTYALSDRAQQDKHGGDVPLVQVYMTGDGTFLRCVEGHKSY